MNRIVNGGKSETHIIKPYSFKSLDENSNESQDEFVSFSQVKEKPQAPKEPEKKEEKEDNSELIQRLLEKIEELSNNFVKSQMEFEKEIKNCYNKCEEEKKKAFEEAYAKAKEEVEKNCESLLSQTKQLYEDSIKKLEMVNMEFKKELENLEKELTSVALDIAKEVIQKEVSANSQEIAATLAKNLMEELKEASKIVLKVNPKDAKFLQGKFQNIKIVPDKAVKEGGVVILSDVGNIDGTIDERFKVIKEAIEGGV